jgi:hypothetical protein
MERMGSKDYEASQNLKKIQGCDHG